MQHAKKSWPPQTTPSTDTKSLLSHWDSRGHSSSSQTAPTAQKNWLQRDPKGIAPN